jgi:ATP-dependent Clp protease ATP-binding subunit ClpC
MAQPIFAAMTRARELAQKKRQSLSTAHVLVALFQNDRETAEFCNRLGFSEKVLLTAAGAAHEEPASGVDLAIERAQKLAVVAGVEEPTALHLLYCLVREPRSAVSVGLTSAGMQPERLMSAAWEALTRAPLEAPAQVAPAGVSPAKQQEERERWERARARRLDKFRSFALSKETESKLARTRVEPGEVDSSRPGLEQAQAAPVVQAAPPVEIEPAPERSEPVTDVAEARGRTTTKRARSGTRPQRVEPSAPASAPDAQTTFGLDARRFPLLHAIGRNLTLMAANGEIDPVIGRDRDIERLLDVLARRRGNNPLLVGAPGVGKTAVVEGLAIALTRPSEYGEGRPARILLEVAASNLLAGTGVRGALSERIQTLRREMADGAGRVLLFIDEIHGILGGAEGDGLGNELKTALARGDLPMIGATTDAEYRRIFERDAALSRRFTRIEISEPSRSDTLEILRGLLPKYSAHHGVEYDPSSLESAIELSVRYLPLRQLPDKAIALMDQAAARVRRRGERKVDQAAVAQVVSELVQVPVERLLMKDREALLRLEEQLNARVVGQSRAVENIAHALRRSAAGFRGSRPLGTFLFAGPTGVGKTEMAKAISEVLFPGIAMTRVDMSELTQPHAIARLLGAPPGYIGHDDGGQLTEAVRHRPYQLVLLDEIEKAHMEVLLSLLPLLDEGRLTDGRGRTVDFTNTVIVMTSNLGVDAGDARGRIGFGDTARGSSGDHASRVLARVRAALPPELWNRIDEPLCFLPLGESELSKIARRMLEAVSELAYARHGVTLEVDETAIAWLLRSGGFDPQLGARPMRRTVGRFVEAPLARALLAGEFAAGDVVFVCERAAALDFSCKARAPLAAVSVS